MTKTKANASPPTSHDVARRAGVSRALVSGVLNGTLSTMRVSEETRHRVLAAAAELNYSPHPLAQALRRQRSNVIGFVPRHSRRTPYEHPVPFLLGIHVANAAMRHRYHVVEASAETTSSRESNELVRFLLDRRVDGVILDSPETAIEVQRFVERGLQVVQVIRPQAAVETPSIVVDAVPGITAALTHLIELGHREIAFLGVGGTHPVDRSRLDCFLVTLRGAGLSVHDEWLRLVADYDVAEGYAAARALLGLSRWPTALFVTGDNLAVGVLQALYEADVRIPQRLSIISYDDIFAAHLAPPLSSVTQPLEEVAEQAVALLTTRLDGSDGFEDEPPAIVLPTRLVERGSSRQPPTREERSV